MPCMVLNLVEKVHYEGCNCQPLAEDKGVHCEVWSLKEVVGKTMPRGTRIISGISDGMRLLNKSKSKDYIDSGV